MAYVVRPDERCPCGELATRQIWETKLAVCDVHARDWLHSPEKLRCTKGRELGTSGGADWDPGEAASDVEVRAAVADFVARIQKERPTLFEIVLDTATTIRAVLWDAWGRWRR